MRKLSAGCLRAAIFPAAIFIMGVSTAQARAAEADVPDLTWGIVVSLAILLVLAVAFAVGRRMAPRVPERGARSTPRHPPRCG
jgi:ABC-type polysaccharide/polyol phosphate export permease